MPPWMVTGRVVQVLELEQQPGAWVVSLAGLVDGLGRQPGSRDRSRTQPLLVGGRNASVHG